MMVHTSSAVNDKIQMAKLPEEELKNLRLKQLKDVARYLDCVFEPGLKDKKQLVDLIMHQRNIHAAEVIPGAGVEGDDDWRPRLKTWGSMKAMHGNL